MDVNDFNRYQVTGVSGSDTITFNVGGYVDTVNVDETPASTSNTNDLANQLGYPDRAKSDEFMVGNIKYTYEGGGGNDTYFLASTGTNNNKTYYLFTKASSPSSQLTVTKTDTTPICFLPGTQVQTPDGEIAVESLERGDLVMTADGRAVPVRWVGRQTISTLFADPLRVLPICIKAGALAENVPSRDLYVSPDHAILTDDILVHASALVNGTSIVRAPAPAQTFTYYHVELADHSLLLADNVPAESFIDNVDRLAFDNWAEHEALGDKAAPLVEMAYPRAKAARQVPVAVRERLAARGQALFGTVTTKAA
jgi:hypothetical protein